MSSLATSSPVSASTLAYLMRWPVFRLSWLKDTFSDSEVAGYSATGQVTSERRKKPFQFARGAMDAVLQTRERFGLKTNRGPWFRRPRRRPRDHFVLYYAGTILFLIYSNDRTTHKQTCRCRPRKRAAGARAWRRDAGSIGRLS